MTKHNQDVYINENEEDIKSEKVVVTEEKSAVNEKEIKKRLAAKKAVEKGQSKVKIKIMPNDAEKKLLKEGKQITDVIVCINGYIYQIQKGKEVEIPKNVAAILEEAEII